jgi:hypothetical protein
VSLFRHTDYRSWLPHFSLVLLWAALGFRPTCCRLVWPLRYDYTTLRLLLTSYATGYIAPAHFAPASLASTRCWPVRLPRYGCPTHERLLTPLALSLGFCSYLRVCPMFGPMLARDTGDPAFRAPDDPVAHVPACASYKKPISARFSCSSCEMCGSVHISLFYSSMPCIRANAR